MIFVGPPGRRQNQYVWRRSRFNNVSDGGCRSGSSRWTPIASPRTRNFAPWLAFIGVGFTAANTIREFIEAIEEFRNKNVLLIDTPGYSISELDSARDLADFSASGRERDAPGASRVDERREDLTRYIRRY